MNIPEHIIILTEANFEEEVIASIAPILIDYTCEWDIREREKGPLFSKIIADLEGILKIGKLDFETYGFLMANFNLWKAPRLILMQEGRLLKQFWCPITGDELLDQINNALSYNEERALDFA